MIIVVMKASDETVCMNVCMVITYIANWASTEMVANPAQRGQLYNRENDFSPVLVCNMRVWSSHIARVLISLVRLPILLVVS